MGALRRKNSAIYELLDWKWKEGKVPDVAALEELIIYHTKCMLNN
jgi:hypothetical protein